MQTEVHLSPIGAPVRKKKQSSGTQKFKTGYINQHSSCGGSVCVTERERERECRVEVCRCVCLCHEIYLKMRMGSGNNVTQYFILV